MRPSVVSASKSGAESLIFSIIIVSKDLFGDFRGSFAAPNKSRPMHNFSVFPCRLGIIRARDLKRIKSFITIPEYGTVSKAAQVLHITQPALSRQISALERDLGFKLFAKSGRRLVLTGRGERLLADSRSLIDHANVVKARAQA